MKPVKVKIARLARSKVNTKYGEKTKVSVQPVGKSIWIGGFEDAYTRTWAEGKEVEVEVEKVEDKNDPTRVYYNFRTPEDKRHPETGLLKEILETVKRIEAKLGEELGLEPNGGAMPEAQPGEDDSLIDEEPQEDGLPF